MLRQSKQNVKLRDYILRNVRAYPASISARAAAEFGVSRVTISNYINRLIDEGLLSATGMTNDRRYTAVPLADHKFQ
jgi:transposase